jgi:N-acetylglucosaminyl-diphospho-decaprenol L-rhamnosyltransferase
MTGSVDTVIVNFRTKELTLDAVNSVILEPETNSVIVIDNASGDDAVEWLQAELAGSKARILASDKNLGFGGGNNVGVREATAEYVFLLNSDAYIKPGALGALIRCLEDPTVGVAGPIIYLPDGSTQTDAMGIFPTPWAILTGETKLVCESLAPDWVTGAAMMVRRAEFLELGGFDEEFFMYLEDVDLCKRYRDRGQTVRRQTAFEVVHLGGGSKLSSAAQKAQFHRSTDHYLRKHGFGAFSRALVRVGRRVHSWLNRG